VKEEVMGTFGQPVYDEEEPKRTNGESAAGPNGSASPEDAEWVDPDDPRLTSEAITDDTTADAYKIPPPAPDGYWRVKLKMVPIKDAKGAMVPYRTWKHPNVDDNKPMFVANVEASLIDLTGKHDGTRLTEQWVKSNIDKRKNTSQMTTITVKAGGKTAENPSTDRSRLDALIKALAGEPECLIETIWEAQCIRCGEAAKKRDEKAPPPFLRGMHRFPQGKDVKGNPDANPTVYCPTCKSPVRAQVRIQQFFKIGEQSATRGLA
jgi:hypothetical protein